MPKVKNNALTAARVRTVKEPGEYTDGNGLTLRVDQRGNRRWLQRISIHGKRRNVGLGSYPNVSLAEAREAAIDNLFAIRQGIDPVAEKQRAREVAKRPKTPTFRQAAAKVIEEYRPTWSSDRHATQWEESLRLHAHPVIGDTPVDEITTADMMAVLTPIWTSKAETASRVRQRMGTVFKHCMAQRWCSDNPATTPILIDALPRRPRLVRHHPALPYSDVPAAMVRVRESTADPVTKLAFEFKVLTAARSAEVTCATWDEIDVDSATWVVPPERMKARLEHHVPLAARALEILEDARKLSGDDGLIFPNKRSGKPLSNMAFSTLLNRLGIHAVPHGFRSSFRVWSLEKNKTPWEVGKAALAHKLGGQEERPYARTTLLEPRRPVMDKWAIFVTGDNVHHG